MSIMEKETNKPNDVKKFEMIREHNKNKTESKWKYKVCVLDNHNKHRSFARCLMISSNRWVLWKSRQMISNPDKLKSCTKGFWDRPEAIYTFQIKAISRKNSAVQSRFLCSWIIKASLPNAIMLCHIQDMSAKYLHMPSFLLVVSLFLDNMAFVGKA